MCIERPRVRGVTLIELVIFIALVGSAMAAAQLLFAGLEGGSADALPRKQALAIAESIMEEVRQMPFTYCDPDDGNASTATSSAGCASNALVERQGAETGDVAGAFDNVSDYHGFSMNAGIQDAAGTAVAGLEGFSASVTVAPVALGGIAALDANGVPQSLHITVTVTGPANTRVALDGMRARYAPNAF